MTGRRPRILVIGAGPAGLSAGVHLLEEAGGELDVHIVSMGHHRGGKAASWRDDRGYNVEHGFHAVFGFYEEMKSLAHRAGVDLSSALIDGKGRFAYYDERSERVDEIRFAHNPLVMLYRAARFPGLTDVERDELYDAFRRIDRTIARAPSLESFDDICYRAFLIQHGVPLSVLSHPMYREVHELAFNTPREISTYIVLKWAELAGHCYHDASYYYFAGGPSELFWDPIATYFERLGGTIRPYEKLVRLEHKGSRLEGVWLGAPDRDQFHAGGAPWPEAVPVVSGSIRRESDFAAVICTLPAACFQELNPGGAIWEHAFFGNIKNLTSVSTLSLQLWLAQPVAGRVDGTIATLPKPLSYVIDYKRMVPEFARDRRYGAALEWVGAEEGYQHLSDQELIANARAELAKIPGFLGSDRADVVRVVLRRNRANHNRYLLTEPGTLKFRPTVETPIEKLFLAGDWVRNEVDGPSIEGAIRCGKKAARLALDSL